MVRYLSYRCKNHSARRRNATNLRSANQFRADSALLWTGANASERAGMLHEKDNEKQRPRNGVRPKSSLLIGDYIFIKVGGPCIAEAFKHVSETAARVIHCQAHLAAICFSDRELGELACICNAHMSRHPLKRRLLYVQRCGMPAPCHCSTESCENAAETQQINSQLK